MGATQEADVGAVHAVPFHTIGATQVLVVGATQA